MECFCWFEEVSVDGDDLFWPTIKRRIRESKASVISRIRHVRSREYEMCVLFMVSCCWECELCFLHRSSKILRFCKTFGGTGGMSFFWTLEVTFMCLKRIVTHVGETSSLVPYLYTHFQLSLNLYNFINLILNILKIYPSVFSSN